MDASFTAPQFTFVKPGLDISQYSGFRYQDHDSTDLKNYTNAGTWEVIGVEILTDKKGKAFMKVLAGVLKENRSKLQTTPKS